MLSRNVHGQRGACRRGAAGKWAWLQPPGDRSHRKIPTQTWNRACTARNGALSDLRQSSFYTRARVHARNGSISVFVELK